MAHLLPDILLDINKNVTLTKTADAAIPAFAGVAASAVFVTYTALSLCISPELFLFSPLLLHFCEIQDDVHCALRSCAAAVEAQIIAAGIAPLLVGVIIIVAGALFVCLNHDVLCLGRIHFVQVLKAFQLVIVVGRDEYADYIGVVLQGVIRAPSYHCLLYTSDAADE